MRNIVLRAGAAACVLIVGTATTLAALSKIGIGITETSINGGAETLSVGYTGAIIGGTTDNWSITLPGITLINLPQVWVEPTGSSGFNVLSIAGSDVLNFQSEDTSPPSSNFCGTGSPLGLGVSCFIGFDAAFNQYYAAVNEVNELAVPELSTWAMMLLGFAGLGFAGHRRARAGQATHAA